MKQKSGVEYALAVDALRTLVEHAGTHAASRAYEEATSDWDIELRIIDVDGTEVPVVSRTFQGFGYLTVEVGTEAGDNDGDVTVMVLKPAGSFSCQASFGPEHVQMEIGESGDADSIRIVVRGHSERDLLSQACSLVAKVLRGNP